MSTPSTDDGASQQRGRAALTGFLQSLEARTDAVVHLRLLKACRKQNPAEAVERELAKIVQEIIDED